ncbi:DUF4145 domain-containing protein [Pseudomonas capsici]|uniref:DUF4145 domain-containing protein n=1 Tax=Pseudomonas capsici TaxID=2810614 RepID=UPI0021F0D2AC|nr:DUF4145 domain-containing protein [Pseudomonas capsici]MCV4285887.1 DUF4145 domain-containing protein [Pseudomonas capsici]
MANIFQQRFDELEALLLDIENTRTAKQNHFSETPYLYIDPNLLLGWRVKAKSLITKTCGETSHHMLAFKDAEVGGMYDTDYASLLRLRAVFQAAKDDYEGGYLNTVRNLVQAEVFSNELEQASELLAAGYASAAAVIAGVVLETNVRNLCTDHGIDHGKLDKMNADLAKAGLYNSIQQKRITAIAGIRNAAAHGDAEKFNAGDVKGMIDDVERFLATNLQ